MPITTGNRHHTVIIMVSLFLCISSACGNPRPQLRPIIRHPNNTKSYVDPRWTCCWLNANKCNELSLLNTGRLKQAAAQNDLQQVWLKHLQHHHHGRKYSPRRTKSLHNLYCWGYHQQFYLGSLLRAFRRVSFGEMLYDFVLQRFLHSTRVYRHKTVGSSWGP